MIYTRKGDKGKTSLIEGKRISKADNLFWIIGDLDELNSFLGIVISETKDKDLSVRLVNIQKNLFLIGSILAGYKVFFSREPTRQMEEEIDRLESLLPVQANFIFPGGSKEASMLFFARSIARRLERRIVGFRSKVRSANILIYLNRLSDYLFILARWQNFRIGKKEDFWKI